MTKKLLLVVLTLCLLLSVGCGEPEILYIPSEPSSAPEVSLPPEPVYYQNPLTGVKELEENERNKRPVAVMVNNIEVAQKVQCGLNDADLVFECLVEGGISRLMAVYYDIKDAGQIGSIRSARYTYVELSRWLDAVYVHHGSDMVYTKPYMDSFGMDDYEVNGDSGFRESNGLAWEHRLYTTGEKLHTVLKDRDWRLTAKKDVYEPVFAFAEEDTAVTPATPCTSVTYAMSGSYKTTFTYNTETGKYTRKPGGTTHKDYKSGKETVTDNVFVLYANSPYFEDGYHLQTTLSSGEGLYISKGGCHTIKWKKGGSTDPLKFTDSEGKELTVNPGTSWIAFASQKLKDSTVIQ